MKKFIKCFILILSLIAVPLIIAGCKNNSPYVTSIEILKVEKRSGYKAFEKFNENEMMIRANYSDGTFSNISSGWEITYVSVDGQLEHNDCFYAGENKVKINFGGQVFVLSLFDEVEKIENENTISIEEYAKIYNGEAANLPLENISILNSQSEEISANFEIIYCTSFEDFENYVLTSSEDGADEQGKAPSKIGTYKVFAKILGGQNYTDVYSNVVEVSIFSEISTGLFSNQNQSFFAWKEIDSLDDVYDYVEFELKNENATKQIAYSSTFAGNGYVMVFSDHMTLVSENKKVQFKLDNNKISVKNNQIIMEKWIKPAYLGNYEMVINKEKANELNYNTDEDFICKLNIFVNEDEKNGEVYFKLICLSKNTEALTTKTELEGKAVYDVDNKKLSFVSEGIIEFISINIDKNQIPIKLELKQAAGASSELVISQGNYIKK